MVLRRKKKRFEFLKLFMKIKATYIFCLFFTLWFTIGHAQSSIIGTWEIDENKIEKDNPDVGPFTLDTASSLFYLLEFNKNNKVSFVLFDIEKKWEINTQKEIVIHSKEGNITARLIDNNQMEVDAIDTQGKEEKHFKFHFNRITKKVKQINPVLHKIYQTKNKDKDGWNYYLVFDKHTFFMFSTNSSDIVNLEMFKTQKFDIKGSWSKERGNYITKGNRIFTVSAYGADKIKIITPKELLINNNHLFLKK